MRTTTLLSASLLGLAALTFGAPASAQVGIQVPGVGVQIGESERGERERRREYRERVEDRRETNTGSCRTETVQKERPDGTTVTREERTCD